MNRPKKQGFSKGEWFWAARPKTLPTAVVPFLSGTFLAYGHNYSISFALLLFSCLSAICIQIGTNFINDAFDFKRGVDSHQVLGPQRATRAGLLAGSLLFENVRNAGLLFFTLAIIFGIPLMISGGLPVALILLLSVISGYIYTGGPFPLAYYGAGDLFVMIFYGLVATNAAYWLQTRALAKDSLLLSLQIGCLCTSMIAINNLRDIANDRLSKKYTLPARYGVLFGRIEITAMLLLPLLLNTLWQGPITAWLPWLSCPLAFYIIYQIWTQTPGERYNQFLALSGINMLSFSLLFVISFFRI